MKTDEWENLDNFFEKAPCIRLFSLCESRLLRHIAIVGTATPGLLSAVHQSVFKPSSMCTVKTPTRRDKHDSPIPEILVLIVRVNSIANGVRLANIDRGKIVIFTHVTDEDIYACAIELGTPLDLRPLDSGKNQTEPRPVHTVDKANPFGVAIRNENANGERVWHWNIGSDR